MDLDEIRKALQDRVLTAVAQGTGVNRITLSKIKNGHDVNLTMKTMDALRDYLAPRHGGAQ